MHSNSRAAAFILQSRTSEDYRIHNIDSTADCLPTPAARCCFTEFENNDQGKFIIGSEGGSLYTVNSLDCNLNKELNRRFR